ncbi:hypothetical protein SEA_SERENDIPITOUS_2 [Mycobacterium phage Serendipitous]|uniref:Uncharacterized protein n=1 Tax=Mycobacterium phage Serendipitous TaxID=2301619 RepID=A0A385UJV4_9CAUD|nr:queuine tRNA-ribosyltransferase [Mycobacterium phage Serendipitous]AYB70544.1 hypothetical protein SEA_SERENDIPITOUS_2 [Mycobacterium phage Serendipitous]
MIELNLPRRCSADEATTTVGDTVPAREPSPLKPGTVVRDAHTGEIVLGYMKMPEASMLRRAVLALDCGSGTQRTNNYRSKSKTFGFAPRRPVTRREACTMTTTGRDHPEIERVLESYADKLAGMLGEVDPALVQHGLDELAEVKPEWRLGETKLWTSGVVNDTAQLPYHRDGFNFPVWSAMPVLRRGTRGGHLHLPEYDLVVPCDDSSVTLFQGSRYVHGVTPITRVKRGEGYRVSVVYYALRGMKNCFDAATEAAYGRQRRTERETEMARRIAAGDRGIPGNVDPRGAVKRMQQREDGQGTAWP